MVLLIALWDKERPGTIKRRLLSDCFGTRRSLEDHCESIERLQLPRDAHLKVVDVSDQERLK